MRLLRISAVLALLVAAPAAAQTPAATLFPFASPPVQLEYDSLAFGRQLTNWFYSSEVDSLWAHTSVELQAQLGTKEKWNEMIGEFIQRIGMENDLVEERWMKRNGRRQYVRVLHGTEFTEEPVMLRWVLIPGRLVAGVGLNPLSRAPAADPN